MNRMLNPTYEGPPNEYVNIWKFGNDDIYQFVVGVAISKQQAYEILDTIADEGRDPNLTKYMEEYNYLGRPFEEIVALRDSGDDDAGDFLHNLEQVTLSESCRLYVDKLRRRGADGEGPVILGYEAAEVSHALLGVAKSFLTQEPVPTPEEEDGYQRKEDELNNCLAEFGLPVDKYINIYVINAR